MKIEPIIKKTLIRIFIIYLLIFSITMVFAGDKVSILTTGAQPGHYLQWNGKPILLIGDNVTQGWMEGGLNFNQNAYIDALAARGINLLMIWSYIGTSTSQQQGDSRIGYNAPEIWPWIGSPDNGSFDLTQLNQQYFDRLKNFVAYAETKGIIVLITVHDGGVKWRYSDHPFNYSNGNGPLTSPSQYVELYDYNNEMPTTYNPNWSRKQKNQYFQERFCDKLINELNPYTNVIYEMFNEGEWYNNNDRNNHEQHFLKFFRARSSNLLLTNTDHISGDAPHNDPKVDIITYHGGWTGRFGDFQSGFNISPSKPYLLSEPVPGWEGTNVSIDDIRRSMWEVAIAGAGWVNQNDCSFGWDQNAAIVSQAAKRDEAYDYAGYCARFFNELNVDFSNMKPQGNLSSTGVCMAKEGFEYIVYSRSGGSFSVNLSAVSDSMHAEWYNPRDGSTSSAGLVMGGETKNFIAPDNNDWVLHLKKQINDTTPPSIPTGLNANPISDSQIELSWNASNDLGSGISHYNIYRDGNTIGQSTTTTFGDTGLNENTAYTYEVSAVNGAGLESDRSSPVNTTTLADTTPPTIISASIGVNLSTVIITFSEPVEQTSATNISNYSIDNGITIYFASLGADFKTVALNTSPHSQGITYTLTVNNILDRASNPNTIAPNTQVTYTVSTQVTVTNLTVASGEPYEIVKGLNNGDLTYIDRSFTYSNIPAFLTGGHITYIKTANDDKLSQGNQFLSFDIDQPATVYIAHDNRYQIKPDWLRSFTNTSQILTIAAEQHTLFKKDFSVGQVTLGGNVHLSEPEDNNMYTIIIKVNVGNNLPPSVPSNLTITK